MSSGTAAVETTASTAKGSPAAVPSSATLSECRFRRTSECNKYKECKHDFEEGGFSHFDYPHRKSGSGTRGRRSFDSNSI